MKCGVSSRAKSVVAAVFLLCNSSPIRNARPISGFSAMPPEARITSRSTGASPSRRKSRPARTSELNDP